MDNCCKLCVIFRDGHAFLKCLQVPRSRVPNACVPRFFCEVKSRYLHIFNSKFKFFLKSSEIFFMGIADFLRMHLPKIYLIGSFVPVFKNHKKYCISLHPIMRRKRIYACRSELFLPASTSTIKLLKLIEKKHVVFAPLFSTF